MVGLRISVTLLKCEPGLGISCCSLVLAQSRDSLSFFFFFVGGGSGGGYNMPNETFSHFNELTN